MKNNQKLCSGQQDAMEKDQNSIMNSPDPLSSGTTKLPLQLTGGESKKQACLQLNPLVGIKKAIRVKDSAFSTHILSGDENNSVIDTFEELISVKPDIENLKIPKRIDAHITSEAKSFATQRVKINETKANSNKNSLIKNLTTSLRDAKNLFKR